MNNQEGFRIVCDRKSIDTRAWERFVREHPSGTVFQEPRMYDVCKATTHYEPVVVACFDRQDLIGILLAVIQREYNGFLGKFSARSIIWGGPLAKSEAVLEYLLEHYDIHIRNAAIYTQIRNFNRIEEADRKSYEMHGYLYEEHLNIQIDLKSGRETFWNGIKKNRKRGINKGLRQGFVFEVTSSPEHIESFYKLLQISYQALKLPIPDKKHFYLLTEKMGELIKWFVLKHQRESIIVMVALVDNRILRPFYIGGPLNPVLLQLRPTDCFHYHVICWAIDNGFEIFDWMGAGKPNDTYGVRDFKLQYGGQLIDMGRFMKVHRPALMKISRIGFWCWQKFKVKK
jgi:hypothetical protein